MLKKSTSEDFYRTTLDQLHEGLQILSKDLIYIYLNEAACLHGEKNKSDLIGKKITDVYPGIENTDMFLKLRSAMHEGRHFQFENEFQYSNGHKRWFLLYIDPHNDGVLIRSIDISDLKTLQEQFWHAQKLDSLGRLAGHMAHDLHNKFNVMRLGCDIAIEEKDVAIYHNTINSILSSLNQCTNLTKQLLAFSRKQVLDLENINLSTHLQDMKKTLSKLMGDDIQIQFHLAKQLAHIKMDSSQLDQIILNLCNNAKDSMQPNGGIITIETEMKQLDDEYCKLHSDVTPGQYVMLAIADTGLGMKPEISSRIFEPFFTTKERGRGTGLGLAAVHGIVKQCSGHIWLYSEIDKGSIFKIYFPLTNEKNYNNSEIKTEQNHKINSGFEGILVVDDEPLLLGLVKKVLERSGYITFAAKNPTEAREIFLLNKDKIQLLLTDVSLPEKSGLDLSEELKIQNVSLKTIYMSGYTENSISHQGILNSTSILLQKPASKQTILQLVRDVLDGKIQKGVF